MPTHSPGVDHQLRRVSQVLLQINLGVVARVAGVHLRIMLEVRSKRREVKLRRQTVEDLHRRRCESTIVLLQYSLRRFVCASSMRSFADIALDRPLAEAALADTLRQRKDDDDAGHGRVANLNALDCRCARNLEVNVICSCHL
jgi:hypothetical protein